MDNKKIIDICNNYYINPTKVEILRNDERVLAKVETANTYYLKGNSSDKSYRETCCTYSNLLYNQEMNVPQYIQSMNDSYVVQYEDKVYSLELALRGKPIEIITDIELKEIGRSLGVLHHLSMKMPNLFNNATSWSLFDENKSEQIVEYDEYELSFLKFKNHFNSHPLLNKIESLYREYRFNLQQVWMRLPQGAVQGDFCYYNMLLQPDNILAIYNFNLAGNEVYLNECIAVAVYHACHAPYRGKLKEQDRFELFMNSYKKERPLENLEEIYYPQLKSILQAFRYDRIELGIALNNYLMQDLFVKETLKILQEPQG